uniref:Small ribosomal subunit protein uS10 domain-containing protein n=1 Tax=Trichogramma kaykai TaxID=54128 RepID=A0ABD2WPZ3_9HYME
MQTQQTINMAANLFKKLIATNHPRILSQALPKNYAIYTPDYLEACKPKYPLYPTLTVKVKGHDFRVLETFQSQIHRIANFMDFDVEDRYSFYSCHVLFNSKSKLIYFYFSYAMPAKETRIVRFKPKTTATEAEYVLKTYARHLVISNVNSVGLPIFIQVLQKKIPVGVTFEIEEYNSEKEAYRFIPDKQLLDLKQELGDMQAAKAKK